MNLKTSNEHYWTIGILGMLMAVTRFHHEGTAFSLPDASLAVFFLGGLYLKSYRGFLSLMALAILVDLVAITGFGVSDYCISPAYVFLLPTYAAMWLGGVWLSRQNASNRSFLWIMFALSLVFSASLAFVFSNGSFFLFSGKTASVGIREYALAVSEDYLPYLGAAFAYALMGSGTGVVLKSLCGLRPSKILGR